MSNSFFTSDTHFGHAKIIKHSLRPFKSVEEMDEQLIKNWNGIVGPKDTVYHLGDFAWRGDASLYLRRLNGNVCKIKGNHHTAAEKIRSQFQWYKDVMEVKIRFVIAERGPCDHDCELGIAGIHHHHHCAALRPLYDKQRIWLSHYAHRVWPRMQHGVWHLYGHSHGNLKDEDLETGLSMDVGVDAIAKRLAFDRFIAADRGGPGSPGPLRPEDYRPVSFDEIRNWMKEKHFTPLDHHGVDCGP
jgi:calcineurin-like phosphoesterase family protein